MGRGMNCWEVEWRGVGRFRIGMYIYMNLAANLVRAHNLEVVLHNSTA